MLYDLDQEMDNCQRLNTCHHLNIELQSWHTYFTALGGNDDEPVAKVMKKRKL